MVLQPPGCGRVGHRHNTLMGSGQKPSGFWPLLLYFESLGYTFGPSGDSHYRCRRLRSLVAIVAPRFVCLLLRCIHARGIRAGVPSPCLVSVPYPHAVGCPPDEKTHVTDQRRPQNGMSRAMLFPWSLLHISQTRPTDTVGRTRFSLNVWRPTIASLISPRLCSGSDRCFCPSERAPTG